MPLNEENPFSETITREDRFSNSVAHIVSGSRQFEKQIADQAFMIVIFICQLMVAFGSHPFTTVKAGGPQKVPVFVIPIGGLSKTFRKSCSTTP